MPWHQNIKLSFLQHLATVNTTRMSDSHSLRSLLSKCILPANEARILLAHLLEKHYQLPRSALLSQEDMDLNEYVFQEWECLVSRRVYGEPIAYILGKKGFYDIELLVGPGVLIPRPETELLVEIALKEIAQLNRPSKVLDLGTGSGAIALAIAKSAPSALITASDQSEDALVIAQQNAVSLAVQKQVQFLQGYWYEALRGDITDNLSFDVIVSNPPYIANQDPHLAQGDLRFEPAAALTDFSDGLTCLEDIIAGAPAFLKPGGLIAVEHGFNQSDAVVGMMNASGLSNIHDHPDLAGHSRATSGRKNA